MTSVGICHTNGKTFYYVETKISLEQSRNIIVIRQRDFSIEDKTLYDAVRYEYINSIWRSRKTIDYIMMVLGMWRGHMSRENNTNKRYRYTRQGYPVF